MLEGVLVTMQLGISELQHFFCVYTEGGAVVLQHEIATAELGEMGVADIHFPPEKARELGKLLLNYANEAEKENANEQ